ncbi:glycoside hydrolase family 18 protein [Streptosporangiaceae bacterium NEAU-GS5]|nr:glycoside hydrolase family 18 protein [Streptosporangiaceae bacterium NEAU-GS5]
MRLLKHALAVALAAGLATTALPPASAQAHTSSNTNSNSASSFKRVAYFIQWGIYGRNYHVKDVETSGAAAKLTHVNYAFGFVGADSTCFSADPWADWQRPVGADEAVNGVADADDQPLKGNLNQLKELKAKHPGLKALISLGGWTGSAHFSDAVLTADARAKLAASCIDLWLKGNIPGLPAGAGAGVFDGIDLDWEWPGSDGNVGNTIRPEDKQNFTLFLAELRKQLDAYDRRAQITAFLPAAATKIDAGFEVSKIFRYLDFGSVQGYDLHGPWETLTGHNGNLFNDRRDPNAVKFSIDQTVRDYLKRGAPARKIVVGMPAYGHGWTGVAAGPKHDGLWQPSTGAAPGTWEAGSEDYKVLAAKPGKRYRDILTGSLWLYNGTDFWSYDDPGTLLEKAAYIRLKGLGGSMMWSIDGDDTKASLTSALYSVLR